MEDRTLLSAFLVTNTADSGPGSLRQAILDSNAATGATNTIDFAIPGQGVQTIAPLSALPAITQAVLIDGFSQPGYAGTPLIELSGSQVVVGDGLTITGPDATIRGLDVNSFSQGAGIHITGTGATGDWIYGSFLGTDPTGTQTAANNEGVEIDAGASNNLIGTSGNGMNDVAERNLLSGNLFAGVWISGPGADGNAVAGNFLGTDVTGTQALANGADPVNGIGGGVVIDGGASDNRIGTDGMSLDDASQRNVIAGNNNDAIDIADSGTSGNIVAGNFLGTDMTGRATLGNSGVGVWLTFGASSNWIGANPYGRRDAGDEGNIVGGNGFDGIQIFGGSDENVVAGNEIGTDATGSLSFPNAGGIDIYQSTGNTIGGDTAVAGNLITNNSGSGVSAENTSIGNLIESNLITNNGGPGVVVGAGPSDPSVGNQITANRIFGNAVQAIDLNNDGVTYNAPSPRQGPNDFQNFPLIVTTADGHLEGFLGGSLPDTTFRIDLFASAAYNADGSGEAEDYLGSLEVTTDASGQVVFAVPFTPPARLPLVTATATDPQGNTSEVSAQRQATLKLPLPSVRVDPGQALIFSATSGGDFAIQDPDAGPLNPAWNLTLSVAVGTLTLASAAGLTGSGSGTGSLSYSGSLAAIDTALMALAYSPPAAPHVSTTLTLDARSSGAPPLEAQFVLTDGFFFVTTMADSGPGSLRQAILDSNAATGPTNTIDFDIAGQGVQTIALASPLPPITAPVLIDGSSQPGYAGTPLVALDTSASGSSDDLTIAGSAATIRGLAISGFAFGTGTVSDVLALPSGPLRPSPDGEADAYRLDTTNDGLLIAQVHATGLVTQLLLLDPQGRVLVESDGLSSTNADDMIYQHLAAGTYTLEVETSPGSGQYRLTTTFSASSVSFQPIPPASSGLSNSPSDVVAGDFTGDGHLDLAVADQSSQAVSVLLSNGDGTFQPAVSYSLGSISTSRPERIVAGDFTGNGHLDLAVAVANDLSSGVGTVSVLLGNGDGTFQPPVTYADGLGIGLDNYQSEPVGIVAGDFTGNGRLDLAVAVGGYDQNGNPPPGEVSILLGNGDGTFQPPVTYADGLSAPFFLSLRFPAGSALAAGDFTGDGRTDLAITGNDLSTGAGEVSVLMANSDGRFQPPVTYPVGGDEPNAIVAGDFSGDGHLDLATANGGLGVDAAGTMSVLLGNGDGTFRPPVTYAAGVSPEWIVARDFTGDGKLDLAVASGAVNTVSLLLGNGDGSFQPAKTVPAGNKPDGIVAGDFNGDGRADLAVLTTTVNPDYTSTGGGVSVLLGNGDGTFQSEATNAVNGGPFSIATGDFNGDGRTDVVVTNLNGNSVSVLLGNGDGTFQPQVTYAVGQYPGSVVVGDFNGDGRLDLAFTDSNLLTGASEVELMLGNGDGTFQPARTIATGIGGRLVAGDFNGDGRLDLAVATYDPSTGNGDVEVLLGNGDGTFQPGPICAVGLAPFAIVAGDFTRDGHLDVAVAGIYYNPATQTQAGEVSILLGNGDGTFEPGATYVVGSEPAFDLAAGDFTGDGRLDLAVVAEDYNPGPGFVAKIAVLVGNGDGTFEPGATYNYTVVDGSQTAAITAADLIGDGHLDLAVTNWGGSASSNNAVRVFLGNGDGTFQPPVTYPVGSQTSLPAAIVPADLTGDGYPDLATANYSDNTVSVLLGNGDGTFVDPSLLAAAPRATPLVADVNGDGIDDVLVVDGHGTILFRQGIPGQPGTFAPPVTVNPTNPSRDIAWMPKTDQGPVLASIDAHDEAISFYAYRNGQFVRLIGSLPTGRLPAEIIAAQLVGDGLDDLVIRNAADGSLSVYRASYTPASPFVGPVGTLDPPSFLSPETLPAGLGVSDVQAVDTSGDDSLDLVVTNKLTGQVSVLPNLGGGFFMASVPYRAGTGLSTVDSGGTPEVTSLEATAGVAAGTLSSGGSTDLVTINPGSNTLDVLSGLGGGRFANPIMIDTPSPVQIVRMADFTGNGVSDLAVLTAKGVSIYLGDGKGGFLPPVTYKAGTGPTGLTVADLLGNGQLDLLVGNAEGDVLVLVGNGEGTFRPFEPVKSAIALAVADLTGNGARDFVFADQSLNRVTVVYDSPSQNSTSPTVIGNQTSGVLAPGAVLLADLTGDGFPDLIVANSGGNNVLVYPGLGNGQFGPPLGGTTGFPVGTDPTGLAVANLNGQPDLLVADTGSNDVAVLLGQGKGPSWTLIPGPRVKTDAGPVALAVGPLLGSTQTDLAVANSGADNVQIFPSVGGGFFNDQAQATKTYAVGQAPSSLFLGNFNGLGQGLATLNAGSNDGTLITGLNTASPVRQTFATGGDLPTSGFAGDFAGSGFTDLVVGNNGDGHLALLMGGTNGLSLSQTLTSAEAPNPTSLSFAGVSYGLLSFYVSTAGREAALNLAFDLSGGPGSEPGVTPVAVSPSGESSLAAVLTQATSGSVQQVSQLLSISGTTLNLAATLLTVSAVPGNFESESGGGAVATVGTVGLGQPVVHPQGKGGPNGSGEEPSAEDAGSATGPPAAAETLPRWERLSIGLQQAWEEARAAIRELESRSAMEGEHKPSGGPAVSRPARPPVAVPRRPATRAGTETGSQPAGSTVPVTPASVTSDRGPAAMGHVIDAALEDLGSQRVGDELSADERWALWDVLTASEPVGTARALVAVVASVSVVGAVGTWGAWWVRRRRLASTSLR
jgi:hypothetical protein